MMAASAKRSGTLTRHRTTRVARDGAPAHPRSVPITIEGVEPAVEQPFAEGAHDAIDADLRNRLISETAYALYAHRGYVDGFDVDDWLSAEAQVDHVLLDRRSGTASATVPEEPAAAE